ncbi:MAG: DUF4339 domain-containing protein [Bdellovibrionales bacterium]|nr:DUF4339 domain-containing protein [Bdellovibrionales bacterium]
MNDRLPARLPPGSATQTQTQWYVVRLKDSGFGGPLNLETLKTAVETGTLAWTDIAYVETGAVGQWKRLFEIESLRAALPTLPEPGRMKKFTERAGGQTAAPKLAAVPSPASAESPARRTPAPSAPSAAAAPANGKPNTVWADHLAPIAAKVPRAEWSSPRYWYLLLDGKEVGPIQLAQIDAISRTARPPASAYGWHVSMKRWKPLGDIPELSKYVGKAARPTDPDASLVIETASQKRKSNRKSLVAAVFQIQPSGKTEMIGVCGDVSPDGFQLLQHGRVVDYLAGTRLDLEIRVSKTGAVPAFRVSAVVKWFNPVKKIAGLEFVQLDAVDRKLLERFTSDLRK